MNYTSESFFVVVKLCAEPNATEIPRDLVAILQVYPKNIQQIALDGRFQREKLKKNIEISIPRSFM